MLVSLVGIVALATVGLLGQDGLKLGYVDADFIVIPGKGGEEAAIGGDGLNGMWGRDVNVTSFDPTVKAVSMWNLASHEPMNLDAGSAYFYGNVDASGYKRFVHPHPTDPTKEIGYVSLEGPEVGTYLRGTAQLTNGEVIISLPEHFSLVTSEDSLTVQLTPRGEWLQLYIAKASTKQLIVREAQGKSGRFDYLIQGIRKGYENYEVVQEKRR